MPDEVSPSSVAQAPDTVYKASSLSDALTKSSVMTYNAHIRKKRSVGDMESGEVPEEPAVKRRAVEPIAIGDVSTQTSAHTSSDESSDVPIPRPTFGPLCVDIKPAVGSRKPCLIYQSTRGCGHPDCKFVHIDPEIGTQAWHFLRRYLRITDVKLMGNHTPRPYLGLASFTLSDAERSRVDFGRTLVDYCYRSFFTLGCSNEDKCIRCHDLPAEGSEEWELFKVGITRVAQRNRFDSRGFDLTVCLKARGLSIADVLAQELTSSPSLVTRHHPCIFYFSTKGCWSPSCCFNHTRPEVGSLEWNKLRNKIEHAVSLPHNAKFNQYYSIGYLGMTNDFKTRVKGPGRYAQRKLVAYCLPSFTTEGCTSSRCNRCHDLPVRCSDEWEYLRDALLSDISQRKLVDDPTYDVLPIIKERGVTIRHSTSTITAAEAAPAECQPHSTTRIQVAGPCDISIVENNNDLCSMELNDTVNSTDKINISSKELVIIADDVPISNNLSITQISGYTNTVESTVIVSDSLGKYTSSALVRAVATAVKAIERGRKSDEMMSGSPAAEYWTGPASILDRIKAPDYVLAKNTLATCTTDHEPPYISPQHKPARIVTISRKPCVNFQTAFGCSGRCGRDHTQPEIGSEAWWELREDLKECTKHFSRGDVIEPLVYLGMDRGFTNIHRDPDDPLVDYCYRFFTTLGCYANSCRQCHLLPVYGSSEWSFLKSKLISYVEDRLIQTPDLDFIPVIKDRGITKCQPAPIEAAAAPNN